MRLRIYVKLQGRRGFKIPAPIGLIKAILGFGGFGLSIAKRYISEDQMQYVNSIDFRELGKSLDVLKHYKGLKIVEVRAIDGTEVNIVI
jgi:hypothetical protein